MTAYIRSSDARKKQDLCLRRTNALELRIKAGATGEDLTKAAEDVRHARLQVIKGFLHDLEPGRTEDCTPELSGRIARLQAEAEEWKRFTVEEIISLHS